ncbi:hypothetical protein WJX73_003787 [Symbiochloris irregularis]|uniref:SAC domain-containing protein n=1 Tax=Symbiochloris irregularis TaxID=706552 RepID=A0AAW1PNJ7_9CHLO
MTLRSQLLSAAFKRLNSKLSARLLHDTTPGGEQILHPTDSIKVAALVQLFRSRGHLSARLDPLERVAGGPWLGNRAAARHSREDLPGLLEVHSQHQGAAAQNTAVADWLCLSSAVTPSSVFELDGIWPGEAVGGHESWELAELVTHLQQSYCGSLTAQMDHLPREQQGWMVQRMERNREMKPATRIDLLKQLVEADAFERFLASKFPGTKRFGVEGCEALLPGMREAARVCADHGAREILVGMPHRGRLNVLCTLLDKPPGALFAQMNNAQSQFHVGDVKYHLGQSGLLSFPTQGGGPADIVRLNLAPNPSHLEGITPVVMGMVRAEQARLGDEGARQQAVGLLVHGDAAFAGMGLAAESLQLANVPGYTTGGTLHLVINNQTGFTTVPGDGRSSHHPTDMAKAVGAAVWHANADDPEAVVHACRMAAEWRYLFQRDAVVDLVGYRRFGHNELDDPKTTQPLTYGLIDNHPRVAELYADRLQAAGLVTQAEVDAWQRDAMQDFEAEYERFQAGAYNESLQQWLLGSWQGDALQSVSSVMPKEELSGNTGSTLPQERSGLPLTTLQWVGRAVSRMPPGMAVHPSVIKILDGRRAMVADSDSRVDFAMAEALALGTLALHRSARAKRTALRDSSQHHDASLHDFPEVAESLPDAAREGLNYGAYAVRLAGQDSERGTFNQRHAALYDQMNGSRQLPLANLAHHSQETVEIWNSPLNEAAVLGFEYGYSLRARGQALVLWEAQFGDFANNAQAIVDQFLAAGEDRWGQQSGLVVMLPHGYEGQGPDHSSARPERYLSLVNDDPAHLPGLSPALRSQMKATFHALAKDRGGRLGKAHAVELLNQGAKNGDGPGGREAAETLWAEMGLNGEDTFITEAAWEGLMVQYMRRNAERHANLTVAAPTTPAQLFHILRRQVNRPYSNPLILLTPKALHFHRQATSALHDFGPGTFFNRVIDDGKVSDNTRHLSHHPRTGAAFTVPPPQAVEQYKAAEVVWCQEEPKNMGAWRYVQPRYETAMRELVQLQDPSAPAQQGRQLRYVGRAAAASPATASMAIHQAETKHLIDTAMSDSLIPSGAEDLITVRGSIPLYWNQDSAARVIKPEIQLQSFDPLFAATRLHFEDLALRYGRPTVVLNLVKSVEKRPRESLLCREFSRAIGYVNKQVPHAEDTVRHIAWDFHAHARQRGAHILAQMAPIIVRCLSALDVFCLPPAAAASTALKDPSTRPDWVLQPRLQSGVLRTNCIDCLDRTNVAQFAYGHAALGLQLHALGLTDSNQLDMRSAVAMHLMHMYEAMGNTLARQYGGSEAHSTVFERERGDAWEPMTLLRDKLTSFRRFVANSYTDAEKQDAINLFLGNFVPSPDVPPIWALDSDYYLHSSLGRRFVHADVPIPPISQQPAAEPHPPALAAHMQASSTVQEHQQSRASPPKERAAPSEAAVAVQEASAIAAATDEALRMQLPPSQRASPSSHLHQIRVDAPEYDPSAEASGKQDSMAAADEAAPDESAPAEGGTEKSSAGQAEEGENAGGLEKQPEADVGGESAFAESSQGRIRVTCGGDALVAGILRFRAPAHAASAHKKLESFDRKIGRAPNALRPVAHSSSLETTASLSKAAYLPQWLASPLSGVTRGQTASQAPTPTRTPGNSVPPSRLVSTSDEWEGREMGAVGRDRGALKRPSSAPRGVPTHSVSHNAVTSTGQPSSPPPAGGLIVFGASNPSPPRSTHPLQRSRSHDNLGLSYGSEAAAGKMHWGPEYSMRPEPPAIAAAVASAMSQQLGDDDSICHSTGDLRSGPRRRVTFPGLHMPPLFLPRSAGLLSSTTTETAVSSAAASKRLPPARSQSNIERPSRPGAGLQTEGSQIWAPSFAADVSSSRGLGLSTGVQDFWGDRHQGGGGVDALCTAWWEEDARVQGVYSRLLRGMEQRLGSGSAAAREGYAALCTPTIPISYDSFSQGPAQAWCRQAGLVGEDMCFIGRKRHMDCSSAPAQGASCQY